MTLHILDTFFLLEDQQPADFPPSCKLLLVVVLDTEFLR